MSPATAQGQPPDSPTYLAAKKKAEAKLAFYVHFVVWGVVSAGLIALNL